MLLIQTVYDLGSYYLLHNSSVLTGLAIPLPVSPKKEEYVVVLDFDTNTKKFNVKPYQLTSRSYTDYLYLGSADGSNSPQWYGTVLARNLGYLFSQTITNLLEIWDQHDPSYDALQQVQQLFFEDLGVTKAADKRYQYLLNPCLFGCERSEQDNKKAINEVVKQFEVYLTEEHHIPAGDVVIYSLAINGELLVSQAEYKRLILQEKNSVFAEEQRGICSITNQEDWITGNTTKLKFKYYITDKVNFASNLEEKNYTKNMAIGKDAYQAIMVGEAYIHRYFNTRFISLPCYIIPEFLFDFKADDVPFDEFSQHIMDYVYTAQTLKVAEKLEREVEEYLHYEAIDNQLSLNFLFYTKAQASFKVNKFIANVPLNHLKAIIHKFETMKEVGEHSFGLGNWNLGLNQLYYMIPMKVEKNESVEKRKILLLYESLLTGKTLSYSWLIQQFIQLAKVHRFEQYDMFQIKKAPVATNDLLLVYDMLKAQLLLKMVRELELLDKGGEEDVDYELQDDVIVRYMEEMAFNQAQSALFLLGMLIAKVGAAQVTKQHESSPLPQVSISNKPILNKINFHGMNRVKLQMLSNDVFEKLRQYKRLNATNELIYAEHKRLFDEALPAWSLSDRENVFYLLSGYAFGTKTLLNKGKVKGEISDEQQ